MRPDERDTGFLWDMLDHATAATDLVSGMTFEDYLKNRACQLAVERVLEIVGEAARRVSATFRDQHPEVPWRNIIGQRNILAHEYGDIEHAVIWDTATIHAPKLVALLRPLVPPVPPNSRSTD